MIRIHVPALSPFRVELEQLFYQRTLVCHWLAVIFFSLFAFLDFFCCRENFLLFVTYRLIYVVIMIFFINILLAQASRPFVPYIMFTAMLLGGLTISLMTLELGGFYSGYYVGILLMLAGALSVLPLRVSQVIYVGVFMYLVYILTVLTGTGDLTKAHLIAMVNNSFFFLSMILVIAVQSHDDLQTILKSQRAKLSIRAIRQELVSYTDGLEGLVEKRLEELEESDLRYQDLYNNLLDMVVLVDGDGRICKINQSSVAILGYEPGELDGKPLGAFVRESRGGRVVIGRIISDLLRSKKIEGRQMKFANRSGEILDVELSASQMMMDDEVYYQLVIRDISATKAMERQLYDSERLVDTSRQAAIFGLARLAECRDDDTGAHLNRMRSYTGILVRDLAIQESSRHLISDSFIENILRSAVLHDIGKVGIPDAVLLKPGRLTPEEFEIMQQHCRYGSEILAGIEKQEESITFLEFGRDIARHHHERWDGSGYPDGLSGNDIPLAARIVSLADVYDALTSTRIYKAAYSHEEAKKLITGESGGQFDPQVVEAFLRQESAFKECRIQFLLQESKQAA